MIDWPKQDSNSMKAFYGDPDGNGDGLPDADFESKYLTTILPPYPMTFSWNTTPVSKIKVHKKCADSLLAALTQIGKDFTVAERQKYQLDRLGGCYNFRLMRGLNNLSIHSWGAAIDIAPGLNGLGEEVGKRANMMPMKAVAAFRAQGWEWGGLWRRPDPMHFQAAKT